MFNKYVLNDIIIMAFLIKCSWNRSKPTYEHKSISEVLPSLAVSMISGIFYLLNQQLLKQWMKFKSWMHPVISPSLVILFPTNPLFPVKWALVTSQVPCNHSYRFPQMNYHHCPQHPLKSYPSRLGLSLILFTNGEIAWFLQSSQIFMFF